MIRSICILLGITLVVAPIIITLLRVHVDGITSLAFLGLAVVVVANRWHPTPR